MTIVWLWLILGVEALPQTIKRRIENHPEEVYVSPISVWEAHILIEKKRLEVKSSASEFIQKALNSFPFRSAPITQEIALQSRVLEFEHEDPADRFLAATAYVYQIPLATLDKNLISLSWLQTLQ